MIKNTLEENSKNIDGKSPENTELIKSVIPDLIDKNASSGFRETLVKSGLDVSSLHFDKSDSAKFSGDKISADPSAAEENKTEKNESTQSLAESPKTVKKLSLRFGRKQSLMAIAGIIAVIILQSAFQFYLRQDKKLQNVENLSKTEISTEENIKNPITAEPEISETIKNPEIKEEKMVAEEKAKIPPRKAETEVVIHAKRNTPKINRELRSSPAQTAVRKKESQQRERESTAQRLRQAEKILTGV